MEQQASIAATELARLRNLAKDTAGRMQAGDARIAELDRSVINARIDGLGPVSPVAQLDATRSKLEEDRSLLAVLAGERIPAAEQRTEVEAGARGSR